MPAYFESAADLVTTDEIAKTVICGPDPKPYLAKIEEYANAGLTHVYLHQVGPDQEGYLAFARQHLLPAFPDSNA